MRRMIFACVAIATAALLSGCVNLNPSYNLPPTTIGFYNKDVRNDVNVPDGQRSVPYQGGTTTAQTTPKAAPKGPQRVSEKRP